MDIGKPQRVIRVEPIKAPTDVPERVEEPAPAREPEPVPAGRSHRPSRTPAHNA